MIYNNFTFPSVIRRRNRKKRKPKQFMVRGPDTELAILRELPHTTVQQSNTLYAIKYVRFSLLHPYHISHGGFINKSQQNFQYKCKQPYIPCNITNFNKEIYI